MPLPTPNSGENEDDFMERCLTDPTMIDDFPSSEQRTAVCLRQWESGGNNNMRVIELSGDVGFEITNRELKKHLDGKKDAVRIKVDSYGGSVFEAVRLYNTIKDYKGKVTAELGAVAASAASFFPLAADRIEVRGNTTFMGHKAWSFAIGNSDDMTAEALILEGLDGIIADAYAKKTGREKKDLLEDMKNEIWLFGGENIVSQGFADAMIDEDTDSEPVQQPEVAARLKELKQRLEESEKFQSEMKQAAHLLEAKNSVLEIVNSIDVKQNKGPVSPGEEIKQEEKMTFNEFIEKNPDAKAEYENLLASAEAKGKEAGKTEGVQEERSRVATLVEKAGFGIGESLKKALTEGMDYKDFAVLEYEAQKNAQANAGEQNLGKFNSGGQTPKGTAPKDENEKALNAWDELYGKKEDK